MGAAVKIPARLTCGDSLTWFDCATRDNLGNEISSPDWTLTYAIRGASSLTLTAVDDEGRWKTAISAVQSAALTAGVYFWQAFATKGSERVTLGSGQITLEKNLATAADGFDGRSQAAQDLAAVQAAIRAMISGGAVAEYTIGNRQIRKMSLESLLVLESRLKAEVVRERRAEKIAAGLGDPNRLLVRF